MKGQGGKLRGIGCAVLIKEGPHPLRLPVRAIARSLKIESSGVNVRGYAGLLASSRWQCRVLLVVQKRSKRIAEGDADSGFFDPVVIVDQTFPESVEVMNMEVYVLVKQGWSEYKIKLNSA